MNASRIASAPSASDVAASEKLARVQLDPAALASASSAQLDALKSSVLAPVAVTVDVTPAVSLEMPEAVRAWFAAASPASIAAALAVLPPVVREMATEDPIACVGTELALLMKIVYNAQNAMSDARETMRESSPRKRLAMYGLIDDAARDAHTAARLLVSKKF